MYKYFYNDYASINNSFNLISLYYRSNIVLILKHFLRIDTEF